MEWIFNIDKKMEKVLLLTGGSSGIGKATVELFAGRGWRVFELSRHGQSHDGIIHVDCDVCDEQSTASAVTAVMQQTDHLDVVISNAGYGISGAIEFTDMADAKRQFDVNFFGALAITKQVLPILRAQNGGRIIYTSSVAGILPVPYQSFYSASKAAINAMALALQNEVRPFGIKVSVLMPGDVSTGFTDARNRSEAGNEVYTHASHAVEAMEREERNGMSPLKMAKQLYHIANTRCPAPQYIGGGLYKVFAFLNGILPTRLVNWIEGKMYS